MNVGLDKELALYELRKRPEVRPLRDVGEAFSGVESTKPKFSLRPSNIGHGGQEGHSGGGYSPGKGLMVG